VRGSRGEVGEEWWAGGGQDGLAGADLPRVSKGSSQFGLIHLEALMQATHCPVCYEPLEVREVAPCMECGGSPGEIDEALAGKHSYSEYQIFGDLSLVLCNFCQCDFGSYDPTYFGLPLRTKIGMMDRGWKFIRAVPPVIVKDKWCPQCRERLSYLSFVVRARELHGGGGSG